MFAPQPVPTDYLRRAAIRLLLRPAEFVANAQDIAVLKEFVTAQAPRYGEIAAATVILTGGADLTVSPHIHAGAIAAAVPDARLIVLDGVGHMLHHSETDAVVAAIDQLRAPAPLASGGTR